MFIFSPEFHAKYNLGECTETQVFESVLDRFTGDGLGRVKIEVLCWMTSKYIDKICKLLQGSVDNRVAHRTLKVTHSTVVKGVNFFQTELMVEIYSKSLVRAISKTLFMKFS